MSILKSTQCGTHKKLTIQYLKDLGFEMRGLSHINKFYEWNEDINDEYEDKEVEIEIIWNSDIGNSDKCIFIGYVILDVKGYDDGHYECKWEIPLETIGDFLNYKKCIIKGALNCKTEWEKLRTKDGITCRTYLKGTE